MGHQHVATAKGLLDDARTIAGDVIADRRAIHRCPELGYQEERTAALVAERLRALGLDEVRTGIGGTGVVGLLRAGPFSGSADRFIITVRGRGGHASAPHRAVDPVVVGAYIVTALQTLVSREIPPGDQGVVTIGSLTAGTIFNAIPDTAILKGT